MSKKIKVDSAVASPPKTTQKSSILATTTAPAKSAPPTKNWGIIIPVGVIIVLGCIAGFLYWRHRHAKPAIVKNPAPQNAAHGINQPLHKIVNGKPVMYGTSPSKTPVRNPPLGIVTTTPLQTGVVPPTTGVVNIALSKDGRPVNVQPGGNYPTVATPSAILGNTIVGPGFPTNLPVVISTTNGPLPLFTVNGSSTSGAWIITAVDDGSSSIHYQITDAANPNAKMVSGMTTNNQPELQVVLGGGIPSLWQITVAPGGGFYVQSINGGGFYLAYNNVPAGNLQSFLSQSPQTIDIVLQ